MLLYNLWKNDGCVAFFNGEMDAADTADSLIFMTPGCKTEQGEHDKFFYHKVSHNLLLIKFHLPKFQRFV